MEKIQPIKSLEDALKNVLQFQVKWKSVAAKFLKEKLFLRNKKKRDHISAN